MRITFVLPQLRLYGGIKSTLQLAEALVQSGHQVTVIYPLMPGRDGQPWWNLRRTVVQILRFFEACLGEPDWLHFSGKLVKTLYPSEKFLPEADLLVLTWWADVARYSRVAAKFGRVIHFARSYERWGGPASLVEQVYALPIPRIANSKSLAAQLPQPPIAIIPNGLDEIFFQSQRATRSESTHTASQPITVGFLYRQQDWKRMQDAFAVALAIKEKNKAVQITIFGEPVKARDKAAMTQLQANRFVQLPSGKQLVELFESLDIFLFTSDKTEAFGNPPLEAMAAGCAVVATRVGAIEDYSTHGIDALHCRPGDTAQMITLVQSLIDDRDLRIKLATAAQVQARDHRWQQAGEKFIQAIGSLNTIDRNQTSNSSQRNSS